MTTPSSALSPIELVPSIPPLLLVVNKEGNNTLKNENIVPHISFHTDVPFIPLEQIIDVSFKPSSADRNTYTQHHFERATLYGKDQNNIAEVKQALYGQSPLSQEQIDPYNTPKKIEDDLDNSETMSNQEAKDKLTEIQYAHVTGNVQILDLQERRRFATWAQYNPEFLALFHSMHSITGDVDYSKTI